MTAAASRAAQARRAAPALGRSDFAAPRDAGLHPLIGVKLWENPCWLSFRINYLALKFNVPVYGLIEERYGLMRPEYVVLYSLGLRDGIAAKDVVASTGFPKNTLSRAIQKLLRQGIIRRAASRTDRRSYVLHLTARGRRILDETVPRMVGRERTMLAGLTPGEQQQLSALLAKLVVDSPRWPVHIPEEELA
jgi:DNA-binding MarR family transcriptional regulator